MPVAASATGRGYWREGIGTLGVSDDNGTNHLVAHTLRAEGHDASEEGTGRGVPLIVEPQTFDWQAGSSGDTSFQGKGRSWLVDKPGRARSLTANRTLAVALPDAPLYYSHDYNQDRIYGADGGGHAVCASDSNQARNVMAGMIVRRLTPVECSRLQGFPDDWLDGLPDSARYRMLGNAVAVPVAAWLGRNIAAALAEKGGAA